MNCIITNKTSRDAHPDADPAVDAANNLTNTTIKITDTKLYVTVVTLSIEDDNKLLEQLKTKQDIEELLNGTNTDQKCQTNLKTTS